jgi:hypothetical protein
VLRREGVAVIWELHLAAAKADRQGNKPAAAAIITIADAVEQEWLRRKGRASPSQCLRVSAMASRSGAKENERDAAEVRDLS